MGCSVQIVGYAAVNNKEYQKHLKAVEFCVNNELSFPSETSAFFDGKIDGASLEDYDPRCLLGLIMNGFEVEIPTTGDAEYSGGCTILVSEIPEIVEKIIITYS